MIAQTSDLLSRRLAHLAGRLPGVDPQLTRVLVPWIVAHPRYLPGFLRLARTVDQSRRVRARLDAEGLRVPPFLILSVTSRCNLRCSGCYASAVGTVNAAPAQPQFDLAGWRSVLDQAVQLGVLAFLIAGGEPFLLPGLVQLFRDYPDRLFLVFTNGTALRPDDERLLAACSNVVIVVSVEGDRTVTDARRGPGVFDRALATLDRLRAQGVLTGISVTISGLNVDYWSNPAHIDALIAHSGPLAMFIEEIPAAGCDTGHPMSPEQRRSLRATVLAYRDRPAGGAFIIHSPGDEETLGGCVSAGRGFAHITPAGDVTACPVSALATHNLGNTSLREALASPLFSLIRENGHLLETAGHPCGLSAHAAELETMAADLHPYRAGAPTPASTTQFPIPLDKLL